MANPGDVKVGPWGGEDGTEWKYEIKAGQRITGFLICANSECIYALNLNVALTNHSVALTGDVVAKQSVALIGDVGATNHSVALFGDVGATNHSPTLFGYVGATNDSPALTGDVGGKCNTVDFEDDEHITGFSGTYAPNNQAGRIHSLSFQTNKNPAGYGPYGPTDGTPFNLPVVKGKFVGYFGKFSNCLVSIGAIINSDDIPKTSRMHVV